MKLTPFIYYLAFNIKFDQFIGSNSPEKLVSDPKLSHLNSKQLRNIAVDEAIKLVPENTKNLVRPFAEKLKSEKIDLNDFKSVATEVALKEITSKLPEEVRGVVELAAKDFITRGTLDLTSGDMLENLGNLAIEQVSFYLTHETYVGFKSCSR